MQRRLLFLTLFIALLFALPTFAQSGTPSVSVSNQVSLNGKVMIDSTFSEGLGFIVIHIDNGGQPGRVAGFAPIEAGWTYNLEVPIDATVATPVLYAMLHVDDGAIGTYEFDGQSGLDNPVSVNGAVVTPAFNVSIIRAFDQFVEADQVVVAAVTMQEDGWLVIHRDANGAPGPVQGVERVLAGTTLDVAVPLQPEDRTPVLWPMLHVDTGTVGEYEFGTVEGADAPVVTRGVLATMPIWTVPHMRVGNQSVLRGDGQGDPNTSLFAESVLAEVDGFLVIHSDQGGQPGPVAGFVRVERGLTTDVTVEGLNPAALTPRLWPMLHVDTGTIGEYEFGVVEGADAPVQVGGNVLTFPINGAPSLTLHNQDPLPGEATGTLRFVVDEALMDVPGWLAIHSNNGGSPGPVLTVAKLHPGSNKRIIIEVNAADAGDLVFPMLHYDTGVVGAYEFGAVEGADVPVSVGGQIVVAPQRLTTASGEPTAVPTSDQAATGACTVSSANTVNRRSTASTNANVVGQITPGQSVSVIAQTAPIGGFVWYQLDDQSFVRADVVTTSGDCASVPTVIPPDAPQVQPPAATQEPGG